jgi:membrane-associated phospholipid phosphatase
MKLSARFRRMVLKNLVLFTLLTIILVFFSIGVWRFDKIDLLALFNPIREGFWVPFFQFCTYLGEPVAFVFIFFILIFFKYRWALMIPVVGFCTMLITYFLKVYFSHPRPYFVMRENNWLYKIRPLENVDKYEGFTSFPSGHTFAAFSVYTLVALVVTDKRYFPFVAIIVSLAVGISRVYLLHHFLHDVLFGMVLGISLAIALYLIQERFLSGHTFLESNLGDSIKRYRRKSSPY